MAFRSAELDAQSRVGHVSSVFVRLVDLVSVAAAVVAGAAMVVILISMLSEVVMRSLWGASLKQNWEISSYAMAAVFFLPAGYALKHGAHVRTSAIEMLAGRGAVRTMDHVCFVAAAITLSYGAYAMTMRAMASFRSGAVSWMDTGIPVWLPEGVMAIGLAIFAAQCLAELLRSAVLRQEAPVDEQAQIGTAL